MSLYAMRRVAREYLKKKKLTPKQRVLKTWPKAACIEVSGCTVAVFACGVIDSSTLLAMAHTTRQAWVEAARKLPRGDNS